MARPVETSVVAWDPVVETSVTFSGPYSASQTDSKMVYEVPPNEVIEVFKVMLIPPVDDTGKIYDVDVQIGSDTDMYETIHIDSVMMPAEHPLHPSVAIDLGVPYLHRPILGRIPHPFEATTLKFKAGQKVMVKIVAREDIPSGVSFTVILRLARAHFARGFEARLADIVGAPSIDASFVLDADTYTKSPVPVDIDHWDELPGGLKQTKPQIFPWVTYALNKAATTPNKWYDFDYPNFVEETWMDLSWNLINKEVAYLVKAVGVHPHSNLYMTRLYVDGRPTQLEYITKPLPYYNYFFPAMTFDANVNKNLKKPCGPRVLEKPFLFHGVKGGIQIIDNGTSIPANGVRVQVYGTVFILR